MSIWALYYGKLRRPLARVVPDAKYPGMWRIAWPDGRLSDMVNLARAKDAAMVLGMRQAPSNEPKLLHWKQEGGENPPEAPPITQNGGRAPWTRRLCFVAFAASLLLTSPALAQSTFMLEAKIRATDDAIAQYEFVLKNGGSAIDRCLRAGIVVAHLVQTGSDIAIGNARAKAKEAYQAWRGIEVLECQRAGLPMAQEETPNQLFRTPPVSIENPYFRGSGR